MGRGSLSDLARGVQAVFREDEKGRQVIGRPAIVVGTCSAIGGGFRCIAIGLRGEKRRYDISQVVNRIECSETPLNSRAPNGQCLIPHRLVLSI